MNESSLPELCGVHKVDSDVEDVIELEEGPEGSPEGGLSNDLVEHRSYIEAAELGLPSI